MENGVGGKEIFMKIRPLRDKVILKKIKTEMSKGGIYLTDENTVNSRPRKGEVLAIGPDVKEVKVGEVIWFGPFNAVDFECEGEKIALIAEHEILFSIDKEHADSVNKL